MAFRKHDRVRGSAKPFLSFRRGRRGALPRPIRRAAPAAAAGQSDRPDALKRWIHAYLALWFLFAGVALYALFFSPFLRVRDVAVTGNRELPSEKIEPLVREHLAGRYAGVFPADNLLALRAHDLAVRLKDRFKKIRSVEVRKKFPDGIAVEVEERRTLMLWCAGEKCFYMDEAGSAYEEVDFSDTENLSGNLLRLTDTGGQATGAGDAVVGADFVGAAIEARSKLEEALGMEIAPEASTPSRLSSEIRFRTGEGWEVFVDTGVAPDKTARDVALVLRKEIAEEDRARLRYVDARTENRIYYAFSEEAAEDAGEETAKDGPDGPDQGTKEKKDGSEKKKSKKK
jgi:cell division septal protein FtsQ